MMDDRRRFDVPGDVRRIVVVAPRARYFRFFEAAWPGAARFPLVAGTYRRSPAAATGPLLDALSRDLAAEFPRADRVLLTDLPGSERGGEWTRAVEVRAWRGLRGEGPVDLICLAFPDALGLGALAPEWAAFSIGARVFQVRNGRGRTFPLDLPVYLSLLWRRVVVKGWLVEATLSVAAIALLPVLLLGGAAGALRRPAPRPFPPEEST